jgi:hypothetical protein
MPRGRSWTDDQFRQAVIGPPPARTLREVTRRLGLRLCGGTNLTLHRHARRLGITLPLANPGPERSWTDDQLRQAAATSPSMKALTDTLGLRQGGPTNKLLRRHADRLGVTLPNGWHRPRPPSPTIPTPLGGERR